MSTSSTARREFVVTLLVSLSVLALLLIDDWTSSRTWREALKPTFEHLLEVVAIAAGVLAVRYEIRLEKSFQDQEIRLEESFKDQKTRIQEIVESMSTRFLGVWPSHLEDLTALAGTANEEFIISVDTLGYGHFSNHKKFLEYFDEVERAAKRGASVKILLPPESMCEKSLELQFETVKEDQQALGKLLRDYHTMYGNRLGPELKSFDDFLKSDLFIESLYCSELVDKATMPVEASIRSDQNSHELVYYWIVRRNGIPKEMIFAYPRFIGVGKGYAFRTQDPKLMDIFSSDFNTKWKKATKVKPGNPLYPQACEIVKARMAAKAHG